MLVYNSIQQTINLLITRINFQFRYYIMMNQHSIRKSSTPSFLQKLQLMLENEDLGYILKWNSKGTAIIILSISALSEQVLPVYFRHNKYASFVRQLNIYGFGKCKGEKGSVSSFSHPFFVRGSINLQQIYKKNKKTEATPEKQIKQQQVLVKDQEGHDKNCDYTDHLCVTDELLSAHNIIYAQKPTNVTSQNQLHNTLKNKNYSQTSQSPQIDPSNNNKTLQIVDLLEQLEQKILNINQDLQILRWLIIQGILKDPRYKKIKYLYLNKYRHQMEEQQNNLFFLSDYDKQANQIQQTSQFDGMEFII